MNKLFTKKIEKKRHAVISLWDDTKKLADAENKTPVVALQNRPPKKKTKNKPKEEVVATRKKNPTFQKDKEKIHKKKTKK